MTLSILQEFKDYAYLSVRVDRFFNVVSIYGRHHVALKDVYEHIPPHEVARDPLTDEQIDERIRRFCLVAINHLSYMGTTNIFSGGDGEALGQIPDDMSNFGFYVCFCYQWNLFESFVKKIMDRAIISGALPPEICGDLRRNWYRTKQFLDCIDSGRVFGRSPFVTVLPVPGWVPATEECGYRDLDRIRVLRNELVHGIIAREVTDADEMARWRLYERSMWILRQFASNMQHDVARLPGMTDADAE